MCGLALWSPFQKLVGYGSLGFVSFCFKVVVKGGLWFLVWRLGLKLGIDFLSKFGFLYLDYFFGSSVQSPYWAKGFHFYSVRGYLEMTMTVEGLVVSGGGVSCGSSLSDY